MARYKSYDYDQLQMVAVSLEDQLVPGTLEYAIHHVIEDRLDTSRFDARFKNDETGRVAYDPKILLKIVLLSYARGMMSSRKMERACRENILYMALSCGQRPDHSTLATFVSTMGQEDVTDLFTQVLLVCEEEGLLGGTHMSIDGLKLPSNAAKEWSGTHSDLDKKKRKLEAKIEEAIQKGAGSGLAIVIVPLPCGHNMPAGASVRFDSISVSSTAYRLWRRPCVQASDRYPGSSTRTLYAN